MAGEKNDAPPTGSGRVDVFHPFALDQTLQSLRVGARKPAEDPEQPTQILEATAQQTALDLSIHCIYKPATLASEFRRLR